MAKRRKDDVVENQGMDFNSMFQSELGKMSQFTVPDPVLCSTGSTLLDTIVGGGLLTGKYHVFAAPAHSGKSTTCVRTIAKFLEMHKNGAVLWVDGEQATPANRLIQLGIPYEHDKDVDGNDIIDEFTGMPKPVVEVKNYGGGPYEDVKWDPRFFRVPVNITLEKAFSYIDKIIEIKTATGTESDPVLVVFDSLDSLPTQKELETDNVDQAIGQRAKVLGYYMKRYLYKLGQYNMCVIFITHIGKKLSMMGPYEAYDGRMSSLKDLVIAGGKPIQFYPYNMITFRARMGSTVDKKLASFGVDSGFIVEATTLKAKGFSFNLVVPLVFNTLKGFDEYPTRYYNMSENNWFKGTVSKTMPEFPDDKFNANTFFEKLEDPEFRKKVDISWKNYLDTTYKKYHSIIATLNDTHQNMDIDSFDETEMTQKLSQFLSMGDVGETKSQTSNTMQFQEEPQPSQLDLTQTTEL